MSMQASVQQLAVEAAVHASKELALQALLIDPVVNSATAAVKLLDELWEINRPYIRPCVTSAIDRQQSLSPAVTQPRQKRAASR
jgi:hypothetical protein